MLTKFLKGFTSSALLLLTAGCAVNGEITNVGDNEYMLTEVDMKLGFGPVRASIVESVQNQSKDFCAKRNSVVKQVNRTFQDARVGSPASYSLIFSCVPKT